MSQELTHNHLDQEKELFNSRLSSLKDPCGSYQQDIALSIFVDEYLTPSFYRNHPDKWREGFTLLLRHMNGFGKNRRGLVTNYLVEVFKREQEIEMGDEVRSVRQADLIRENEPEIYALSIEKFQEFKASEGDSRIASKVSYLLEDIE